MSAPSSALLGQGIRYTIIRHLKCCHPAIKPVLIRNLLRSWYWICPFQCHQSDQITFAPVRLSASQTSRKPYSLLWNQVGRKTKHRFRPSPWHHYQSIAPVITISDHINIVVQRIVSDQGTLPGGETSGGHIQIDDTRITLAYVFGVAPETFSSSPLRVFIPTGSHFISCFNRFSYSSMHIAVRVLRVLADCADIFQNLER